MSDIQLDDDWDILIEDGDLVFISQRQFEAKQAVVMTLKAFRGEWFKDITYGVPWMQNENNDIAILGKTHKTVFDSYVRGAILSNEEITSIISYESILNPYSGEIIVEAKLDTPSGPISIREEIANGI